MVLLKDITYKINKLELRKTKSGKDFKEYYEIVEYLTSDSVYTIAIFRYNKKENIAYLEFVQNRYKDVNWIEFKELIDVGYRIYEEYSKYILEEDNDI